MPGLPLYRAMNYTMQNGYSMGMHTFVSAALDATAIAMGILLISGLAKVYKTSKRLVSKRSIIIPNACKKRLLINRGSPSLEGLF